MSTPRRLLALTGLAAAIGAAALPAEAPAPPGDRAPSRATQGARSAPALGDPGTVMLYHVTGVIDEGNLATSFHCTNLGPTAAVDLRVSVFEGNGAVDCNAVMASLPSLHTGTLSTTSTTIFNEDAICNPGPTGGTVRGSARISADVSGSLDIVCTAELVDKANATPLFLEKLDIYDRELQLVGTFIFIDSFESGSTARWSAAAP